VRWRPGDVGDQSDEISHVTDIGYAHALLDGEFQMSSHRQSSRRPNKTLAVGLVSYKIKPAALRAA
jgi:hypothetical protein